jgi:hypothetical protein
VLDEPDVYLHADLQKKLIKVLAAERYKQTIVATHSLELIADVSPNEIVSISKRSSRSRPLSSSAQAQSVAESLGTNLNIQISKVANAGKIIFVEGKDHAFLDQIAYKFGGTFYDRFSKLPHFGVGGMNNWRRAATTAEAFHQTSSGKVCSDLFLDRDYKSEESLSELRAEALKSHLNVIFWSKKEIENFFWDLDLIVSYIQSRSVVLVPEKDVAEAFERITAEAIGGLPILIADGYQSENRRLALPTAMKQAQAFLKSCEQSGCKSSDMISGKAAISRLSAESQSRWNVQVSPMSLCRHMEECDIPTELRNAVRQLTEA